jgi:hypothetical protein
LKAAAAEAKMAERESEHVRMIDAGRMRASFASSVTTDCFRSARAKKFHCYAHGNTFGLSFVAAKTGAILDGLLVSP